MRGLLTADWHVHPHKALSTIEDGMNSRLRDGLKMVDQVIEITKEEHLDFVAIAGDLFHVSPPFAEAYNWLGKKLAVLGSFTDVYLIAGNHDLRQLYYVGDPMDIPFLRYNQIDGVHVLDSRATIGDITIAGFHHQHLDRLSDELDACEPADILLLHQSVVGASNDSGFTFPEGLAPDDELFQKFGMVVCGHIHKPQHPHPKFLIPGSPLHLNFGDSGDRFFWIYTDGIVEKKPVRGRRFVTVATEADVIDDGNHYRIDHRKDAKTERLKLPGINDAIVEYCDQAKGNGFAKPALELADQIKVEQTVPSDYVLESIELNEFGPFESVKVDVRNGLNMILGEWMTQDGEADPNQQADPGRSNGAGKSTLFEGISWVLYGRTAKGIKGADVMRRLKKRNKKCFGRLTFKSDGRGELIVTRTQAKKGSTLELQVNGKVVEGKSRDTQADLVELLGFSYDFFRQMIYFGQETAQFFSQMGDADRKKILSSLLGLEWYDRALVEVKKRSNNAAGEVDKHKQKLEQIATRVSMVAGQIRTLKRDTSAWEEAQSNRLDTANQSVIELENDRDKAAAEFEGAMAEWDELTKKDRDELDKRLTDEISNTPAVVREQHKNSGAAFEKRLRDAQDRVKVLQDRLANIRPSQELSEEMKGLQSSLEDAKKQQQELLAELQFARGEVKRLESERNHKKSVLSGAEDIEPGTRCSSCGAEVTDDTKAQYLEHLQTEYNDVVGELDIMKNEVLELDKKWGAANESVAKLMTRIDEVGEEQRSRDLEESRLSTEEAAVKSYTSDLADLNANIDRLVKNAVEAVEAKRHDELGKFDSLSAKRRKDKVEAHEVRQKAIASQIKQAREFAASISSEKCPYDVQLAESQDVMKQLMASDEQTQEELTKSENEQATWTFWIKGFGREGIPAALLEGFCTKFTEEANALLASLSTGMRVQLSPSTTIKSGEVRDRLEYLITTKTGQSSYEQLSGGEKVRVDVVSMLTLHMMAVQQYSIENGLLGILILDEVFSALDGVGCELVYDLLESFGARSVYVISHSDTMKSLFKSVLTVRNLGDKSVVV